MRTIPLLVVLACAGAASLAPPAARAQPSLDQRALEPLQPQPATSPPAKPTPAKPAPPHHLAPAHPAAAHPAPPQPPEVKVPLAPPPPPVLPPPLVVPARPPRPAAADPDRRRRPGGRRTDPVGLRITFGTDRADLNPATETALRALVHSRSRRHQFHRRRLRPRHPRRPLDAAPAVAVAGAGGAFGADRRGHRLGAYLRQSPWRQSRRRRGAGRPRRCHARPARTAGKVDPMTRPTSYLLRMLAFWPPSWPWPPCCRSG